jgi:hypothetical protein
VLLQTEKLGTPIGARGPTRTSAAIGRRGASTRGARQEKAHVGWLYRWLFRIIASLTQSPSVVITETTAGR